jgi:hypothetical protein
VSDTTTGAGAPEYLEVGGGAPLPPGPPAPPAAGGGRRRGLLIGGGLATLGVIGVGAWAAAQFFATGAQPAEALPATTLGYASIDLDPSGGQKIEALRTLNKFPGFKDEFGLDADDDIRQKLFDESGLADSCEISYDDDIEPWLGERMAVAAVDLGEKQPEVVMVLQVKDAEAADEGLRKLRDCESVGEDTGGWVIEGDWALVADDVEGAQAVADATADGTLAEDAEYKDLTTAAGSAGIVSLYAAPEAGAYLSDSLGEMTGLAEGLEEGLTGSDTLGELPDAAAEGDSPLEDFGGAAVTVRFDDGALEVEGAAANVEAMSSLYTTDRGGDVVETLPAATAAAFGVGFEEGWLTKYVEQMAAASGGEMTAADLFEEASAATGLDVPEDVETLFGESAALAFGSDFDPEAFFNSGEPNDLPIGLKVKGDEAAARKVLTKILDQLPPEATPYFALDSDDGYYAIGPNEDFRTGILGKGDLGTTEVYQDVVRESDKATLVVFVNFNAGDDWLVELVGEDPTVAENVEPLGGFGITSWVDDDYTHGVLRLTTD